MPKLETSCLGSIPLVDCHRHLGGSISPEFVWSLVSNRGMKWLGESLSDIEREMRCMPDEPKEFYHFLKKFEILNQITWDEELIDLSIQHACQDLIHEGVDYCWMHFTINKYMQNLKWHRTEAIKFVCDAFERHAPGRIGGVLCLKYESTRASQRQIAALLDNSDVVGCASGIDLVGDEGCYDASFYGPALKPWVDANKAVFAHVGESRSAKNIGTAIEYVGVREVCHGIRLFDQPGLVDMARDNDVCFHMALTSNELTGVTKPDHHPIIAFLAADLPVTIGTDDPTQCNTTMANEYDVLRRHLVDAGMCPDTYIDAVKQNAVDRVARYG